MSTEKKTNVSDILSALKDINLTTGFNIWVPSLGRTVKFSDITTGQQKEMIRALVDNPVYRTNFIVALYNIIKNNCQDTVNVDSFNLFDKFAIAVQLRQNAIGQNVKVEATDKTIQTVELNSVPAEEKFVVDPELLKEVTISHAGIELILKVPSIAREVQLENELRSKLSSSNIESYEDIRNVLADAYIGELAKYTHSIKIGEKVLGVGNLGFKQVYSIVETLPTQLVKQAINFLEDVQRALTSMATYKVLNFGLISDQHVEITLDAAFFAGK